MATSSDSVRLFDNEISNYGATEHHAVNSNLAEQSTSPHALAVAPSWERLVLGELEMRVDRRP
jgi:hypothetical protein